MSYLKYVKNIGLILVILGHYYFCSYVLAEVHDMKNYESVTKIIYQTEEVSSEEDVEGDLTQLDSEVEEYDESKIGTIEIPKIDLERYLYEVDSTENDVDKNIEILSSSDMPNVQGGNFILAAHNGNSAVGHFRDLYKVTLGDEVIINYKGNDYTYEISKIYDVLKTGSVAIKRDSKQTTITLITCLGNDRQLVVIGYLK